METRKPVSDNILTCVILYGTLQGTVFEALLFSKSTRFHWRSTEYAKRVLPICQCHPGIVMVPSRSPAQL